jgi:hypothetical protein
LHRFSKILLCSQLLHRGSRWLLRHTTPKRQSTTLPRSTQP